MNDVKVSIVCISYNQQAYISDALKGFLSQKVNFKYEIIIADDCSTDKTAKIIKKYQLENPNLIKLIHRKKNIGIVSNLCEALKEAKGEYIALCEGDDYWTDTEKLQLQADFLDKYSSYALCFHPVKVIFENNEEPDSIFPNRNSGHKFTIEELLRSNYIQTNSVIYRKQNYNNIPNNILPFDWYLHLYHAQFGKIGFIDQTMSVYRRHQGGIWWSKDRNEFWQKHGIEQLNMYAEVLKLFSNKPNYTEIIYEPIGDAFKMLAKLKYSNGINTLNEALRKYPDMAAISIWNAEQTRSNLEKNSNEQLNRIKALDVIVDDQQEHIVELESHINATNEELKQIVNSKAWKTIKTVRAFGRLIHSVKVVIRNSKNK